MFSAYSAYVKGKDYTPESHGGSRLCTASTDYENSMPSRSGPDPLFFMHQLPHAPPPPLYYHPPYYPYQYSYYPLPNAVHPPTAPPPHPSSAPSVPLLATGGVTDSYSSLEKLSKLGYNPGN
ncbi:hypothetical protein CY34DRAFT_13647 [Suillus luteus UH-Slu-Lm8-n1]|uniref:Uncharacterized protein n=1 Tax=Suillus luteus UH-Slu-Lm8-n1 TaxID=930992 RepID=A0A0D0AR92_9AGAM|nr:hypothetical protein CY34DRAFT_13647 [Suillus luteus UH-Slu-Lm8-n1]